MTPAAILSQIANTEAAYRASLGSQPGTARPASAQVVGGDVAARLAAIRDAARARREYATADALRGVLAGLGVTARDGARP